MSLSASPSAASDISQATSAATDPAVAVVVAAATTAAAAAVTPSSTTASAKLADAASTTAHAPVRVACLNDMKPHHHLVWSALKKYGACDASALGEYIRQQAAEKKSGTKRMAVPAFATDKHIICRALEEMEAGGLLYGQTRDEDEVEFSVSPRLMDELATRKTAPCTEAQLQMKVVSGIIRLYKAAGVTQLPITQWCYFHLITCFVSESARVLGGCLNRWCAAHTIFGPFDVKMDTKSSQTVTAELAQHTMNDGTTVYQLRMTPCA
jgi:hypothetical protein